MKAYPQLAYLPLQTGCFSDQEVANDLHLGEHAIHQVIPLCNLSQFSEADQEKLLQEYFGGQYPSADFFVAFFRNLNFSGPVMQDWVPIILC